MEEQYSNAASGSRGDKRYPDSEVSLPIESSAATEENATRAGSLLADGLEQGKNLLSEHKGKLAIGVAATLGMMVFYKWREKKLAQEDPEEYARLQRLKAVVRANELDSTADNSDSSSDEDHK